MTIVPYEFRPARFAHPSFKGYWVRLYLLFDGKTLSYFFHRSEQFDNCILAKELGIYCSLHTYEVLVTPTQFSDIYNQIEDYVRCSDSDKEL